VSPSSPIIPGCCHCRTTCSVGSMMAVLCLAMATGCNNVSARARNAEGVRLFDQARYQEAMQHFQAASYADPKNADSYYNLAACWQCLGRTENRQSDLDQAEEYYNRCLDHDSNHRDCYRRLAVMLAEEGRDEEAFRLIEGWVDREPNSADARIELARLFEEFGNREAAKEHLIGALSIEPSNARALAALGKVREDLGDRTQALAAYQRSLWHDRLQPEVAARVSALQSTMTPATSIIAGDGPTRVVGRESTSLR